MPYDGVASAFLPEGYASTANFNNFQLNSDINVVYNTNIGDKLTSSTTGGFNYQYSQGLFTLAQGRDLAQFITTVAGANVILEPLRTDARQRIGGGFLQETLGWDEKLFLTLAGRIDASSVFSEDERTNFYPKVGMSYVLSEEPFFQSSGLSSVFSAFKLRASYGESGSLTAIGPYDRFTDYAPGALLTQSAVNVSEDILGDEDIRVESLQELELGIDLAVVAGRVGLSLSYYSQEIDDLIVPINLAASQGGRSIVTNVGSMENSGIEISLNATPVQTNDLEWSLFGNFSSNDNEVTRIDFGAGQALNIRSQAGAPAQVRPGEALSVFYGSYIARDENGDPLLTPEGYLQRERGNPDTGEVMRDADGQPEGEFLDKVIGDPNPDYILGFGTSFRYKKINRGCGFRVCTGC